MVVHSRKLAHNNSGPCLLFTLDILPSRASTTPLQPPFH
uniref:Uncharacterized protein n=1 Tax=Arundo donax TaxID=35708 RepID=A0A0A9ASV0_ARUDO